MSSSQHTHVLMRNPLAKGEILVVATSCGALKDGSPTGVWLSEVAVPYVIWKGNGYDVTIASPHGGPVPVDPASRDASKEEGEEMAQFMADDNAQQMMGASVPLDKVQSLHSYAAVYLAGGHGAAVDFPTHPKLGALLKEACGSSKVVAALCHGTAGLLALPAEVLKGRQVACFSDEEERCVGKADVVPQLIESELRGRGANVTVATPGDENAVIDTCHGCRLITGQNPASAFKLASLVIEALTSNYPQGAPGHHHATPSDPIPAQHSPGSMRAREIPEVLGVSPIVHQAGGGATEQTDKDMSEPSNADNLGPTAQPAPGAHTGGSALA